MLSIGEFSKTCLVSIKTLHHYDKLGLIHPHHVDPSTGYRYYTKEQIPDMLLICRLKRYRFSLAEIKSILTESDVQLADRLKKQKQQLQNQIDDTAQVIRELELHLLNYEKTGDIMSIQKNHIITMEEAQPLPILSSRQHMSTDDFGKYYGKLFEQISREGIPTNYQNLAIYHDQEFNHEYNDTEVAIVVLNPAYATRTIEGRTCATTIHKGAYSTLSDSYGALVSWIQDNGYEVSDSPYEIYLKNRFDNLPPEQWETKIFFPVRKSS